MNATHVIEQLRAEGCAETLAGMTRYGIPNHRAFGISVGRLKQIARDLGKDHHLALELWAGGWYEARIVAVFIAQPRQLTPSQMEAWAHDFDSWAI